MLPILARRQSQIQQQKNICKIQNKSIDKHSASKLLVFFFLLFIFIFNCQGYYWTTINYVESQQI